MGLCFFGGVVLGVFGKVAQFSGPFDLGDYLGALFKLQDI